MRPTARALPWGLVAGILGFAALPMLSTVVRGGDDLGAALLFAVVVGATVAGVAVEDDAAELFGATPVPLARRRAVRLAVLVACGGVVLAVVVLVGRARDATVDDAILDRVVEVVAVAGASTVVASGLAGRRRAGPGAAGALAGPLVVLFVTGLAQRVPWLPSIGQPHHHERWWLLAAVAWVAVAASWRDPAAVRPLRSRG